MGGNIEVIEHPVPTQPEQEEMYSNPYFEDIDWDQKFDGSLTFGYALKLYRTSQTFTSWSEAKHDVTATANHVVNTCGDAAWKGKLQRVLSNAKYGWNGHAYGVALTKKLLFDLAHDIAYNYITHCKS